MEKKMIDVIVIGAGISGMSASVRLSEAAINHIILEGRDRTGGRIYGRQFEGINSDFGASFLHSIEPDHVIFKILQGQNCVISYHHPRQVMEQNIGEVDAQTLDQAIHVFQQYGALIKRKAKQSEQDLSIYAAGQQFYERQIQNLELVEKNLVHSLIELFENAEGGGWNELSARAFYDYNCKNDGIPSLGYQGIFRCLQRKSKGQIYLNQKVEKINYEGNIVQITTQKGIFCAKYVICSLPLGILQNKLVQFQPKLPESKLISIDRLGFGIMNKIFVSFEQPFWREDIRWIEIASNQKSKYPSTLNLSHNGKYVLCSLITGQFAIKISKMSDQEVIEDFVSMMKKVYRNQKIKAKSYAITRWNFDEFSLGSFSFLKTGSSYIDTAEIAKPLDGKLWFVGQHCHPNGISCGHNAYETGLEAAQKIIQQLATNNQ